MEVKNPFTPEEDAINTLLVKAYEIWLTLPQTHISEPVEMAEAMHRIQYVLFMRILRRDYPHTFPTNQHPTQTIKDN